MKAKSFEAVISIIDGLRQIKANLDKDAEVVDDFEKARKLAIKYWSMISTIDECIYSLGDIMRTLTLDYKVKYSKAISQATASSEAGKKRVADNDINLLSLKSDIDKINLYHSYLLRFREDVFSGHYMMKASFERLTDVWMSTPKTNI